MFVGELDVMDAGLLSGQKIKNFSSNEKIFQNLNKK